MFSEGAIFKDLNISLDAPSGKKSSFQSIDHLNKLSKHYFYEIKEKLHPLSPDERHILTTIINSRFNFRHQSNSNLSDGTLYIKSYSQIQSEGLCTNKNTYSEDKEKSPIMILCFLVLKFLAIRKNFLLIQNIMP